MIYRKAFTLIEIIISISIILLLVSIGYISYERFAEQQDLDEDVVVVEDVLQKTRSRTMARQINPQLGQDCKTFGGYNVTIRSDVQQIEIREICEDTLLAERIDIPNQTFQSSTPNSSITFSYPEIVLPTTTEFVFKSTGRNRCKKIIIQAPNGLINLGEEYDC